MIIGYDGSRAFNKNRTGTENYSYQLLKHLAKIDTENSYVVYIRSGCKVDPDWPANFKFTTISLPRLWTQVGLAFATFIDPLDVLFIPSHTLPIVRKPGLKTVLTVHDLGAEFLPQHHQLKQRLYLSLMTNHQLSSASKLIAVSESTKKDIVKKVGIRPERIAVVYEGAVNTTNHKLKKDALDDILKRYDIVSENYFLFVGTIQPRKNLERLIKAYGKVVSSQHLAARDKNKKTSTTNYQLPTTCPDLVLAGSKGWLSDEIYKSPKQLGIENKVKFLGYVPDEDLIALYQGATAFTYPSLFEGFGLPILEAMSQGIPVLTSNSSSLPEVAGEAAILVDPNSIDEIEAGLNKLLNKGVRVGLTKKGYEQVKRFSWDKAARETLKVLEQVAKSR